MKSTSSLSQISILLFIVASLVGPIILGGVRPWIFIPPFLAISVVAAFGLFRAFLSLRKHPWKPDLIDCSVLLFTLYSIVQTQFALSPFDSRLELLKVFAYAIGFFFCRYGIERRILGVTFLFFLIITGFCLSIFGFILLNNPQFLPFGETFHIYYAPRLTSTFGCPNHIGYFLVMTSSIALAVGFFSSLPWVVRIIVLYSAIPMMIAIGLTLSRGSWIALVFALLAIAIAATRLGKVKKWIPITFLSILVIGGAIFLVLNKNIHHRVLEGFNTETLKFDQKYIRVQLFFDSLKINRDYPLWGTGSGTFVHVHPRYQNASYPSLAVFAHNDYAHTLAEYGIVGLLLVIIFVVSASYKLSRNPLSKEMWQDRVFLVVGAACMSSLIIHSALDFNLHIPANALVFFSLIGLALRRLPESSHSSSTPSKLLSYGALATASLLLILNVSLLIKTARGVYPLWTHKQQERTLPFDQDIKGLLKAFEIDSQSNRLASYLGDLYRSEAAKNLEKKDRFPLALEAIRWYQTAQKLNPWDDTITVRLAMSFDLMERYMEAYQCYRQAILNQPYSGYFWVEFATHYWRQGLLVKAEETYHIALRCPYHPENIRIEMELLHKLIQEGMEKIKKEAKPQSNNEENAVPPPNS